MNYCREDPLFRDPSFEPISAVGSNAAIIHYSTLEGTDEVLTLNKVYLLDAGGQYEDCTTDVTRTHHFGPPTFKEKVIGHFFQTTYVSKLIFLC